MRKGSRLGWCEPAGTLSQRVGRGVLWMGLLGGASGVLQFLRTIVLARLLTPRDFGLMGIVLVVLSVLNSFSQTGFKTALVHKEGDIEGYLDTAWAVRIARGALLAVILVSFAPGLARFFGAPAAEALLKVVALAVFLEGWTNVSLVYLQKELDFSRQFVYQFSMVVADFLVALGMAFVWRDVWALVCGFMVSHIVGVIVSYRVCPYRPRLGFDWAKARELSRFGKWVFVSNLLEFLNREGDHAIIGKWLGATSLGWYRVAHRMTNLPAIQLTQLLRQVVFPAYARLQNDSARLREAYLQTLQLTALVAVPLAIGMIALAPGLVGVLLGERWLPITGVMQILAVFGLSQALAGTTGPLFLGIGRPDLLTRLGALRLVVWLILIFPLAFRWGVEGAAVAATAGSLVELPFHAALAMRLARCRFDELSKMLLLPLLGSGVMVAVLLGLQQTLLLSQTLKGLLVLVGVPGLSYLLMVLAFERWLDYGLVSHLKERFQSL